MSARTITYTVEVTVDSEMRLENLDFICDAMEQAALAKGAELVCCNEATFTPSRHRVVES